MEYFQKIPNIGKFFVYAEWLEGKFFFAARYGFENIWRKSKQVLKYFVERNKSYILIMKNIGLLILVVGLIGLIFFGYQAMQDSESFSVLGVDVAVSNANWTPVIISGVVFVIGLVMAITGKKK